jgi:hypothetical protein
VPRRQGSRGNVPHPYAAYLRVYEPLAAFADDERTRWAEYAADTRRAVARADRLVAEHRTALAGVLSVPPRPVPTDEEREAFVLDVEGLLHVCPVQTRLRSWVALGQFRDGLPDPVLHAFVPPASLARADADHQAWGEGEVGSALRILTATWSVPLPWFVPFAPSDRVLSEEAGSAVAGDAVAGDAVAGDAVAARPGTGTPTVVHRTRMSAARRRVARALRTLTMHLGDLDVVDEVEELARWLEEFHARSWLELDYAGLARLLGPEGVASDTSVADVAASVAALGAGDEEGAVLTYRTVADRWAAVAVLEHAN